MPDLYKKPFVSISDDLIGLRFILQVYGVILTGYDQNGTKGTPFLWRTGDISGLFTTVFFFQFTFLQNKV